MIQITIDPKNMYFGHELDIVYQAEVVINWVLNPAFKNASMLDTIKQQYLFGWFPIDGGVVEDGIMKHTSDLWYFYPLLYVQKGNFEDDEHFYLYKGDVIAIKTKGTYEIARID